MPRGAHDLADLDRRDVGAAGVHPRAHRRVEREVLDLRRGTRRRPGSGAGSSTSSSRRAWAARRGGRPGGTGRSDGVMGRAPLVGDSAATRSAARPRGSSAVDGTTPTVSAPASWYAAMRAATASAEPSAQTLLEQLDGDPRRPARARRAPPRARSTRSPKPSVGEQLAVAGRGQVDRELGGELGARAARPGSSATGTQTARRGGVRPAAAASASIVARTARDALGRDEVQDDLVGVPGGRRGSSPARRPPPRCACPGSGRRSRKPWLRTWRPS